MRPTSASRSPPRFIPGYCRISSSASIFWPRTINGRRRPRPKFATDLIDRFHELAESVHPRGETEDVDPCLLDPEVLGMLIQLGYISAEEVEDCGT